MIYVNILNILDNIGKQLHVWEFQMISSKIEELMDQEKMHLNSSANIIDEARQKQLLQQDEEEDFLDEGKYSLKLWEH